MSSDFFFFFYMYLSDYLCIGYIILNNNSNSDKNIHNFRYFKLILTHIISHVSTRHVRFRICWKCLVWRSLYCTVCKDDFCAKTTFRRPYAMRWRIRWYAYGQYREFRARLFEGWGRRARNPDHAASVYQLLRSLTLLYHSKRQKTIQFVPNHSEHYCAPCTITYFTNFWYSLAY